MTDDLTSAIVKHDHYFSRVIDMIPADLYKHTVSEDADGAQEGKYAKNRKLPLTAAERKSVSKAKKNEKYAAVPTANIASSSSIVESTEDANEEEPASSIAVGGSGNLETLREKLQARIMGLKAQRVSNKSGNTGNKVKGANAEKPASATGTAAAPVANKDNKTNSGNNNKSKSASQESDQAAKRVRRVGTAVNDASDVSIVSLNSTGTDFYSDLGDNSLISAESSKPKAVTSGTGDLQFNLIAQSTVLGAAAGEGEGAPNGGKPKGTKLQRLQRLLQEAEKKRARMKQLTAHGGEEGLQRLQGEKWNDALKSARGERTLIVGSSSIEGSEGKIKNALKKREKKKAKSAEAWADRLASVKDAEALKIQKREGNINQRRMKMKGIEIEPPTEAAPIGNDKQPVGAGSGRKRLYHVLKYGNSEENGHQGGDGDKGGKHGGGGGGGGKPHKSGGGGGGGDRGGKGGNRAGFEGKKKVGEYLNK